MKHHGSLEDLQTLLAGCGFSVDEVKAIEHGHCLRTREGPIVNWYSTTGTVSIQGKAGPKKQLENAWAQYTGDGQQASAAAEPPSPKYAPAPAGGPANKKVFLVHGHDDTSREQLELVLHKLGLDPFVLANTGGGGLTIIEALEKEIGPKEGQARFGIVLLTPDDMGYAKKDGPDKTEPRARQNVVLEMGMLIAAVGRPNVAILKKGHLEVPSDAQGILYIPFNDHIRETVPKLVDRLRAAGFVLNPKSITNASS
ncbi:MAG: nucleotide-binding protein [Bryobacteraceae bacterium]|nr:nucleotide-binding protein [Bryobacteraceae bacterium]